MSTEMLEQDTQAISYENPFVGLRPFDFEESHLYFGRDGQVEKLLVKLKSVHFVAVVGVSGSGKSSLVRAGLLPALLGGFMRGAGSDWKIALMRPGDRPVGRLAEALIHPNAYGSGDEENDDLRRAVTEATLLRGSLGLIDVIRHANRPSGENLLVVVDQFEEIFRYADASKAEQSRDDSSLNEAAAFVKLLLEAARQRDLPIYVMLTMRSDFLGNCAQFWDLPEAINEGQYLIPRMTYDERREAITGPVAVGGAEMTQRLVNQLLADLGEDPAQLPVLQHALMRTWEEWHEKREPGHRGKHEGERVDLCCYEAIGGMKEALSLHAEEAYREAGELFGGRGARIAEDLFKTLTELDESNRATRRPAKLLDICRIIGADEEEIQQVIEIFRRPDRSFLTPRAGEGIEGDTMVDISHESLIGNWGRLKDWVVEESKDAQICRDLGRATVDYLKGPQRDKAILYGGTKLWNARGLQDRRKLTEAWVKRHRGDSSSDEALSFLRESEKQEYRSKFTRRLVITILVVMLAGLASLTPFALWKKYEADEARARSQRLLYVSAISSAYVAQDTEHSVRALELLEDAWRETRELCGFEWFYLWNAIPKELATLKGHTDAVYSVAYSPDGRTLASGSSNSTVKIWEVSSGKELATLKGHTHDVRSVAYSPDGRTLASGSYDGTVKIWEVSSGKELATLKGHTGAVASVAYSPDGRTLASGSYDGTVKIWEVSSGKELGTLKGHTEQVFKVLTNEVNSVAYSPDGRTLALGSDDGVVKIWEMSSGKELGTLKGHTEQVMSVAYSPDGRTLASVSDDGVVKIWEVSSGKELATLKGHTKEVNSVAYSPDGRTLASGSSDSTVKIWEASSGKELATLRGHIGWVTSVVYSPDGRTLASGNHDNSVKIWEVSSGKELATLKGHTGAVASVAYSPDGRTLASGSSDSTVKIWEVSSGKELATLKEHTKEVNSVAYSPDGRTLASGSDDGTVILRLAATEEDVKAFEKRRSAYLQKAPKN